MGGKDRFEVDLDPKTRERERNKKERNNKGKRVSCHNKPNIRSSYFIIRSIAFISLLTYLHAYSLFRKYVYLFMSMTIIRSAK